MRMFGAEIAHSLAQKAFVVGNLAIQIRDFSRDQRVVDLTLRLEEEARRLAEFPLKISTPTSYPPVSSRLLLDDVLRQWGTGWCSAYNGIRAEMDLQCRGVAIHINEELFRGALHKLVENALHAMADTGGQLSLTSRVQNGRVGILLADTGPGIPERHRADFLRRKVEKDANEPGTGMGAIMARMVFQYYGGDVQLVATGTQGTTLLISLPLSPEVPRMSGVVQ
ncbi:MAG: HAMP domain-containing histidine kinase [Chloroflexi bacterium]|nr:HAMP domain-containing histidine kinase [Chloroflexota bacterium]